MTNDATAVLVMSDYDILTAFITVGYVYDTTHSKQYISLCLRDSLGYAMTDRDIHIAVDNVQSVIDALQTQLIAFKETNA